MHPSPTPDERVRLGPADAGRCRRRIHLDHDPTADPARRKPPDPGLLLRMDDLAAHRRAVHETVAARLELAGDWDPGSAERPAAIWAPRLATPTRIATPDLLLRADDGLYVPVLIRGHRTTDPGSGAWCSPVAAPLSVMTSPTVVPDHKARSHTVDALALAHVYRMLQELGLASRHARGGVIGRGGPAGDATWDDGTLIVWHELARVAARAPGADGAPPPGDGSVPAGGGAAATVLADYDARFADRLAVARAAAARQPALAGPSRIAECRHCPWWPVCGPELAAAHDVSMLVAGSDVDLLHSVGVVTYDDLAGMDPQAAAALPLTGIPPADARARALALIAGVPLARRTERVDARRADVELDVDMESYSDDGAYLWGTYLSGAALPGFVPGYRPFVTWEPLASVATAENFRAFWRYLSALRRASADAGLTFAAYCYSRKAEERWLYGTPQRFADVPDMPGRAEIDAFCSSPQWVDLYAEVKRSFVVPGSLRLKTVATVAGFAWRDPEPSGENSMAWYRIATGTAGGGRGGGDGIPGDRIPGDAADAPDPVVAHRQRILRYNEDDVRATLALRRWMSDRAGEVPTVAELDAAAADGHRPARAGGHGATAAAQPATAAAHPPTAAASGGRRPAG